MCAAALAGTAGVVSDVQASIITFNTPITVPSTFGGIYINLLTGATGSSSGAVSGWDFNPYASSGGTQLGFYWDPTNPTSSGGVATTTASGPYLPLSPGDTVSAAQTFTRNISVTSLFLSPATRNLGFRFFNEGTGIVNYGALSITTGGGPPSGFPSTINGWSFDNTGAAFVVPGTVPEASTGLAVSIGALAVGAVQLRKWRRQQRQAAR